MSVIKEIKTNFSAIAWCPLKEHVSMMAVASMVKVSPVEEETEKKLALYDWSLENVDFSKYACEESLSAGVCSMSWGCTSYPEHSDAKGLLCLGLQDGSVQLWIPKMSEEKIWKLEMVILFCLKSHFSLPLSAYPVQQFKQLVLTVITTGHSFVLVARMVPSI
jgi:hypothetical protein